jgi:hypothetical protein
MEVKMETIPVILMFLFYVAIAVFLSNMIHHFVKAVEKIADGLTK